MSIMKLCDKVNLKTELVDKKYFKYQCTYIWASVLVNGAFIGTALALCLGVLLGVLSVVLEIIVLNVGLINEQWVEWFYELFNKPSFANNLKSILILDFLIFSVIFSLYILIFTEHVNGLIHKVAKSIIFNKMINLICKVSSKVYNCISFCYTKFLDTFCKQIPRE